MTTTARRRVPVRARALDTRSFCFGRRGRRGRRGGVQGRVRLCRGMTAGACDAAQSSRADIHIWDVRDGRQERASGAARGPVRRRRVECECEGAPDGWLAVNYSSPPQQGKQGKGWRAGEGGGGGGGGWYRTRRGRSWRTMWATDTDSLNAPCAGTRAAGRACFCGVGPSGGVRGTRRKPGLFERGACDGREGARGSGLRCVRCDIEGWEGGRVVDHGARLWGARPDASRARAGGTLQQNVRDGGAFCRGNAGLAGVVEMAVGRMDLERTVAVWRAGARAWGSVGHGGARKSTESV